MKKMMSVLFCVSALILASSSFAAEKKETKRKPSSMATTSRKALAAHLRLDVADIPANATRFCALVTTTPGFGTSTVSRFYSAEGRRGKGTCVSYDVTYSYDESLEKNMKRAFSEWGVCQSGFRDAVARAAGEDGDAVEGSLRNPDDYKGATGEFSSEGGSSSKFDCGDLQDAPAKAAAAAPASGGTTSCRQARANLDRLNERSRKMAGEVRIGEDMNSMFKKINAEIAAEKKKLDNCSDL